LTFGANDSSNGLSRKIKSSNGPVASSNESQGKDEGKREGVYDWVGSPFANFCENRMLPVSGGVKGTTPDSNFKGNAD
jgi:hypothetical protein